MLKLIQFCKFQRALAKLTFLEIAAQAFESGEFPNFFLRVFEAHFLKTIFLIKKRVLTF